MEVPLCASKGTLPLSCENGFILSDIGQKMLGSETTGKAEKKPLSLDQPHNQRYF